MSVAIYDGLRSTVADPFEFSLKARKIMEELYYTKAFEAFDYLKANPDTDLQKFFSFVGKNQSFEKSYDLSTTVWSAIEKLHRSPERTFSKWDIGYDLMLLPNSRGENPLVLIYSADSAYREALISAGLVEEYGYWNNVDLPEHVSDEEWDERRKAWAILIEEDNSPSNVGLLVKNPNSLDFSFQLIMRQGMN